MAKGWLDNYGKKENANESSVSLPEGFVGMGNNTKGRNYSPAWGGQFQMGGDVYPVNYVPQAQNGTMSKDTSTPLIPYSNEYIEGLKNDYLKLYNNPDTRMDDGYDAFYHSMIDNLPDVTRKAKGWIEYKPGTEIQEFTEDDGNNSAPTPSKNRMVKRVEDYEISDRPNTLEQDKLAKYIQQEMYPFLDRNTVSNKGFQTGGSISKAQDGYQMGTYFDEDARERESNMMEETYDDYNTAMTGMMKSKMATQAALGNPGAKRMMSNMPAKYIFTGNERFSDGTPAEGAGAYGSHYISNRDNYVYPNLQDNGEGTLNFIPNASSSDREAMRFENPGEADYFANHYKEVAPMMKHYFNKLAMGGSIPGSVGFTYARTKGIPSNGPYAKKTLPSAQNGVDMYNNPIIGKENIISGEGRSYYNPRTNVLNLYDADPIYEETKAHENYHAKQFRDNRTNFDIANNTENAFWAEMQKRPEITSTDELFENYHDRKRKELELDRSEMVRILPETRFMPPKLIDKYTDRNGLQYRNPYSVEGEAEFYGQTGEEFYKLPEGQNGKEVSYYQNGLDWKPKGMKNGGWLDGYDKAQTGNQTFPLVKIPSEKEKAVAIKESTKVSSPKEQKKVTPNRITSQVQEELKFMKDWTTSPMYNTMLNNSTKGVEDEQDIKNIRKERLNDISFDIADSQSLISPNAGGVSRVATGDITFYPLGYSNPNEFEGMAAHEISHTQDSKRNPLLHLSNKLFRTNINTNYIPQSDVNMMNKYSKSGKTYDDLFNTYKDYDPYDKRRDFFNYVTEPTETRARLNSLRYVANKNKIYNPFKEKINAKQLEKLEGASQSQGGFDAYDQLRRNGYSKEEILNMLNTISQNKDRNQNPNIATAKDGRVIKDDRGQWDHPGEITEIGSNNITMQGVPYPVLGISDTGDTQMMYPEEEYEFDGEKVTEYPIAKNGMRQEQKGLVNLDNLLNFTNYNKPQPGGWLSKYE